MSDSSASPAKVRQTVILELVPIALIAAGREFVERLARPVVLLLSLRAPSKHQRPVGRRANRTLMHQMRLRMLIQLDARTNRTLDFGRRAANAIPLLQHVFAGHWLAIDADEIVRGVTTDSVIEQLLHRYARFDFDVICKAATIVVDVKNSHASSPLNKVCAHRLAIRI